MARETTPDQIIDAVWKIVARRVSERTASAVELLDEVLHAYGRVHRRNHELWVGERVINDDRELLPKLSRATSLGVSVYLGNRRVASSSVVDAGTSAGTGGFADAMLVDVVLRKRETFRGVLELQGRPHIVACKPLFASGDADYGPLGMIEAFQDIAVFKDVLLGSLREGTDLEVEDSSQEQADRMEAVMHFIDDVARRLQLLALNGNIIAAQAGDHGRAFRVVCRELSSLADQSKDAVAEVRRLTQDFGFSSDDADFPQDELGVDHSTNDDPIPAQK